MSLTLTNFLSNIPESLRNELIETFLVIERNFRESRWEPAELNGGKLCEIVYSILRGHADGNFPASAYKPRNMVDACKALENEGHIGRSLRIQIPRMITALYEIRNNRGVGHVGGDVNANHMDSICVLSMAKWIVAELVRHFHNVSVDDATAAVEALSDRELSLVWNVNGVSRVLDTRMSMLDKTLVILYAETNGASEAFLIRSLEHSNASVYRRDVLRRAHKRRLIEYVATTKHAIISPLGIKRVEEELL